MKKKSHYNADSDIDLLYDTQTGTVIKNKNGYWIRDERSAELINPEVSYEIFDIWPSGSNHAIIAVSNHSNYVRSYKKARRNTKTFGLKSLDFIYYTEPRNTIYELDLQMILKAGISYVLFGEDPPVCGTSFFSDSLVIDEFKPLDNDYIQDGTEFLDGANETNYNESFYDINEVYEPLYPRVFDKDSNLPIKNRQIVYGAPLFFSDGTSYLDPYRYRDIAVGDYFTANRSAEHIGLGKLIVNVYFTIIGESLRGYSIGGSVYWGPLVYSKNSVGVGNTQLYSYLYNAGGLEYIGNKYEFNDCSTSQYIGSEFSFFNYENEDRMIQFRWNFWNYGSEVISEYNYYPKWDGVSPLPALDKASELRNFPDFPRQSNYNIPGTWVEAEVNGTKGASSYPIFFINSNTLSFSDKEQVQKLKIFAARNCVLYLDLLSETVINNYAPNAVRTFSTETFFFWSNSGPYNLTAGQLLEIDIAIAPIVKNSSNTLKSNRYIGSYLLRFGDLEDSSGQLAYLDLIYLPEYEVKKLTLISCRTNATHVRQVFSENLNYIISDRYTVLSFDVKWPKTQAEKILAVEVDKVVGNITITDLISCSEAGQIVDVDSPAWLQIRAELNDEQYGYIVLKCILSCAGEEIIKKYGFQVLPQQSLISKDFAQLTDLFVINENDIYLYFEKENSSSIEFIPIKSFGNYIEIFFEDGYEKFISFNFINNSVLANGSIPQATTTSYLEIIRKPEVADKDFFVRGWVFNRKITLPSGEEVGTNVKIPFYVSNYYPCHCNFMPVVFS